MYKIAFFDVDGTLLNYEHTELSEKTVTVLRELKKRGVLLCIATGRSYPCVPRFDGVDFDILMSFNGAYITNDKEVIRNVPIQKSDADQIIRNLKEMNRAIAISNEKILVANGTDPDLEQFFAFGNETIHIADNFDELCEQNLHQIMCSCNVYEHERILKGTKNAKITYWWDKAVDIIPGNSGKGAATRAILDYYNFSKEDAIAFGDGGNDVEMLLEVGTGVAMGNAIDEVKAQADEVCGSVQQDGIYYYFAQKLGLE